MSNDRILPSRVSGEERRLPNADRLGLSAHVAGLLLLLIGLGMLAVVAVKALRQGPGRVAQMEQVIDGKKLDVRVAGKRAPLGAAAAGSLVGSLWALAAILALGLMVAGGMILASSPYDWRYFRDLVRRLMRHEEDAVL